jgi:hypothetical protein
MKQAEADSEDTNRSTVGTEDAVSSLAFATVRPRRTEPAIDFRSYSGWAMEPESGGGQLPLADPRYTVVTTGSSRQDRSLREALDSMASNGRVASAELAAASRGQPFVNANH